jgi:hypothetical protein
VSINIRIDPMMARESLSRSAGEGGERSEPGEGLRGAQRRQNCLEHAFGVGEDVVVPESQHALALTLEPFGSLGVRLVVGVLTAIGLDNQMMLGADEVDDISADGVLSPELETGQTPPA